MLTWVCDIPGASPTVSTLHFALHASLAVFVVVAGSAFLVMAWVAYRRTPSEGASAAD